MSSANPPSGADVRYHPVPGATDFEQDAGLAALYENHDSHTPRGYASEYSEDGPRGYASPPPPRLVQQPSDVSMEDLHPARPRFMGAALAGEGPSIRDSYASSDYGGDGRGSPYDGSTYALHDTVNSKNALYSRDASPSPSGRYRDDPNSSKFEHDEAGVGVPMPPRFLAEKQATYAPKKYSRKRAGIYAAAAAGVLVILAVVVGVVLAVDKHKDHKSEAKTGGSGAASPTSSGSPSSGGGKKGAITGGSGSTVVTDDGSTFVYQNEFGGTWYFDPEDPFNNAARAQSWSPALNESFNWGVDQIRGVNLGGWLVTEPFIAPALYEPYVNLTVPAVDEWTLSWAMGNDTANGGMKQLENHYATFITEQDFAQIAGAGLNFVRIPIPYWAIETRAGEPFLAKTAWTYFVKAIKWARKYGIRINLDFHALPGSQNGWNHSGRLGDVNVLNGPMGLANAQRSLDYIRIIAEFIAQPEYSDVVVMFGITNEPQWPIMGNENLSRYYLEAYNLVRGVTSNNVGQGPLISYHDGFAGLQNWAGFLPGADRIALDLHPYLCFTNDQPTSPMSSQVNRPCSSWGAEMNTSMDAFGLTGAGEWSNAVTDCGKWVNGVGLGARYEGQFPGSGPSVGSCDTWVDWQNWDAGFKTSMQQFAMASMDSLQNWFFWTWKIGNSTETGTVMSPAWSYQLGLENGWMPKDPRSAVGWCNGTQPWSGTLAAGNGQIAASATASIAWPPTSISNGGAATLLPSYTPTGTVPTLTAAAITASGTSINVGDGWFNTADSSGAMVAIATCSYLDPWVGPSASPPSPLCDSSAARMVRRAAAPAAPTITPAPQ